MISGGTFSSIPARPPSRRALGALAIIVVAVSAGGVEVAPAFFRAPPPPVITVRPSMPSMSGVNIGSVNNVGVSVPKVKVNGSSDDCGGTRKRLSRCSGGSRVVGTRSTGTRSTGTRSTGTRNIETRDTETRNNESRNTETHNTGKHVTIMRSVETHTPPPPPPPPVITNRVVRRGGGNVVPPPVVEPNYVTNEVVVEFAGTPSDRAFNTLAARHRLTRLDTQRIALTNSTWVRWRIADRRSVPTVVRALAADGSVRSAQPNYLYAMQQDAADAQTGDNAKPDQSPDRPAGDPGQYALAKLHLAEAQATGRGGRIVVAVIDTEIDRTNPELAGAVVDFYDALGETAAMEAHGTGIAGTIAAHARLLGAAPDVRILAVRAFGGGHGTTFGIIKGLDWAVSHDAKVINMSFAGPADPAIARAIKAAYDKGRILIAAAGNRGPKSPPLYPAADPHVIAVTATDANDKLFAMANRGDHVAVAAPGVDILVAAPDGRYLVSSGTSFAAAYVSGIAALLVEGKPDSVARRCKARPDVHRPRSWSEGTRRSIRRRPYRCQPGAARDRRKPRRRSFPVARIARRA